MKKNSNANFDKFIQSLLLSKGEVPGLLIGEGKFSKVYRIQIQNQYYALKQLKREVSSVSYLDNVLKEVIILENVKHQNLLTLLGKYRTKEFYFFILEYNNGGDLKNFISNYGKIKEPLARDIIKQLVSSLQYLHYEKQIIHRDIKPANIMMHWGFNTLGFTQMDQFAKAFNINENSLEINLGDFGFARRILPYELVTSYFGTPLYMAPEIQCRKPYDFKADIWSLGISLFEILTGTLPFNAITKNEITQKIKTGQYQISKQLNLSPYCIDFINQCLQFNPKIRASASDLLNHPFLTLDFPSQQRHFKTTFKNSQLRNLYKSDKDYLVLNCNKSEFLFSSRKPSSQVLAKSKSWLNMQTYPQTEISNSSLQINTQSRLQSDNEDQQALQNQNDLRNSFNLEQLEELKENDNYNNIDPSKFSKAVDLCQKNKYYLNYSNKKEASYQKDQEKVQLESQLFQRKIKSEGETAVSLIHSMKSQLSLTQASNDADIEDNGEKESFDFSLHLESTETNLHHKLPCLLQSQCKTLPSSSKSIPIAVHKTIILD